MKGSIIGDVVGSSREFAKSHEYDFELFPEDSRITDDTVLTVATMAALMNDRNYANFYYAYAQDYEDVSWGGRFYKWAFESEQKSKSRHFC